MARSCGSYASGSPTKRIQVCLLSRVLRLLNNSFYYALITVLIFRSLNGNLNVEHIRLEGTIIIERNKTPTNAIIIIMYVVYALCLIGDLFSI